MEEAAAVEEVSCAFPVLLSDHYCSLLVSLKY